MKQAVAVVIKKDDRFLLIKRAKKDEAEDYWCPVTGAVEPGETQEQAVIREAQEELQIDVMPIKKVWECFTENEEYLLHWWYVKLIGKVFQPNPEEVKEYRWINPEQMRRLKKTFSTDLKFFQEIGPSLPNS